MAVEPGEVAMKVELAWRAWAVVVTVRRYGLVLVFARRSAWVVGNVTEFTMLGNEYYRQNNDDNYGLM